MLNLKNNSIDQNLFKINKHIKEKSYSEAKEICLILLRKYPNNLRIRKILNSIPTNNDDSYKIFFNKLTSAFNTNNYEFVIENGISFLKNNLNDTNINNLVAAAYLENKQYDTAIQYCNEAIKLNPKNHFAFYNRGVAYSNLKKSETAIKEYKEAINIKDKFIDAYIGISNSYWISNQNQKAISILENAPEEVYKNTKIQKELGKHYSKIKNYNKAKFFLNEVVRKDPYDAISLFNLHTFYFDTGDYDMSSKYLVKAYNLDKNNLKFNEALAEIYIFNYYTGCKLDSTEIDINYDFETIDNFNPKDLDKCKFHLDKINEIDPTYLEDNYTFIMYLFIQRETDKAIEYLKKYIENLDNNNIKEKSSKISAYLFLLLHSESHDSKYIFNEHLKFGNIFENQLENFKGKYKNKLECNKTIKVGFVSKDFKEHAAKSPILTLWKNLEKFNIEIQAFNNEPLVNYGRCGDFKQYINKWHDIYDFDDPQLADYIFQEEIDILVDLSGHTNGNRLLTFAYKPAPIQISCIGYPGTTGLKNMDYVLCDERIAPRDLYDKFYIEKMLRIPSAAAWAPLSNSPEVKKLPALKNNYISFGSFNYPRKVTKKSIKIWSKILLNNPNSIIVQCAVDSKAIKDSLVRTFEENGIEEDRIKFLPRLETLELLKYLNDNIDICLDTTMYTGGTTTNHALWMGVPVITLRGKNRVQGQSASCLEHVGLGKFVAKTEEEYICKANFYSKDLNKLNEIRLNLRKRWQNSKWRDPNLISNGFARGLRKVWENYCENKTVNSIDIKLEDI